jgi:hypothetical protein
MAWKVIADCPILEVGPLADRRLNRTQFELAPEGAVPILQFRKHDAVVHDDENVYLNRRAVTWERRQRRIDKPVGGE